VRGGRESATKSFWCALIGRTTFVNALGRVQPRRASSASLIGQKIRLEPLREHLWSAMRFSLRDSAYLPKINTKVLECVLLSYTCLALAGSLGEAQNDSLAAKQPVVTVDNVPFQVNSELVLVPVSVLDRGGRPVVGLQKDSFTLLDNDTEQIITHFAIEDVPVSVGFVIDASGSMLGKMEKAREAVKSFLNTANSEDEFFLVRFNGRVDLAMDLTRDAGELQKQIRLIQPFGATALLDAIRFSITQLKKAKNARKSLIIVSDGGDNSSEYTATDLRDLVRETDIQINAIGIFEPVGMRSRTPEETNGPELLQEVTTQTGGRLFEVAKISQMPKFAWELGRAIRAQYLLGYAPNFPRHDGKYHRVEVKLVQPKGSPNLKASWRRGYYSLAE
jgi:Ca-activated chloride channel homolog